VTGGPTQLSPPQRSKWFHITVGITLIVALKRGRNIPIPFGPYLAGGGLIALFWGQTLTQSYLHLLAAP